MDKEARVKTILYLIRHGATEANLARPARLQGRNSNPPLACIGKKQAEATRNALAKIHLDACYTSPLQRAMETAQIICSLHEQVKIQAVDHLIECDVGKWEGADWGTIRQLEPEQYEKFHSNPGLFGYPGGESMRDVHARVAPAMLEILQKHVGQSILVVAHHVVNRTFLASLLGLHPDQARNVVLDNCGISVVVNQDGKTRIATMNSTFHLDGIPF